ncbi:MAG: GIY-YIG nuclease family protein [Gammaproteobacteria bacterium]|nr:GIY-YIG nuclease family protein [Gammaproteobacteria bacterium]
MTEVAKESAWFVYMVRCRDNSLYSGVTTDLARREHEHNSSVKGAKYTRVRRPVSLVFSQAVANRSMAGKLEARLKKLTKKNKERLISQDQEITL